MIAHRKRRKFKLILIRGFDARHGYKRCSPAGVGVHSFTGRGPKANSDFWRDRTGKLVLRISSNGWTFHYEALLVSGKQIPDDEIEDFGNYIAEVLYDWLAEGFVDDPPAFL